MTDTAREAAIARVRAYVEARTIAPDDFAIDHAYAEPAVVTLTLGDLRLLLSGEGGSVASLLVKAADEPATPLSAELLAARQALEPFVAVSSSYRNFHADALPFNGDDIEFPALLPPDGDLGKVTLARADFAEAEKVHARLLSRELFGAPRQPSEAFRLALRRAVDLANEAIPPGNVYTDAWLKARGFTNRYVADLAKAVFDIDDTLDDVSGHPREAQSEAAADLPKPPVTAEGWRPIESAPRDGTHILTFKRGVLSDYTHAARWIEGSRDDREEDDGAAAWREVWAHGRISEPTHWRPLPPAPPSGEGGGL